ncbi:porin [Dulcicalothrix desertica PCC 7102]|uniref:Porin n=1 Tax=Dulcicalothrix desertica PCC 7102 TaxID=232991 RepID=A0A433VQ53_9CYAN|nr:iron uptake porin [Dulcicalothrix desertica]RUT08152.1 porin [Dulcicalothrix desertica PCC 7102]TWH40022.1 porin [Dulcicalothrix desertica PCC 7102]
MLKVKFSFVSAIFFLATTGINFLGATTPSFADTTNEVIRVTSASQLKDVEPTDWAFQALQSLVERYGVIAGYPDASFSGKNAITRYEFAAGLNAALNEINQLISAGKGNLVLSDDLIILQRLQSEFAEELATLQARINVSETRNAELSANQFSTTTKLTGQVVMAVNAGEFAGEKIIAPRGAVISENDPNPTFIYRSSLDLNTSFKGTDLLKIRLVTGSDGANDNATGFLEANFGSVLDYSIQGRNNQISLARLYYSFAPSPNLKVSIGPALVAPDFVDKNRYANVSFKDFSTQAFANNFILLPRAGGAGAVIDWHPKGSSVKLRAVYIAGDATNILPDNQRLIGGGGSEDIRLFPNAGGGADGGLFGDPYQGFAELEYSPSKAFNVRLQYSGGKVFGSSFQGVGVNFDYSLNSQIGIFGRYGYASYTNTSLGNIYPNYWMAGFSLQHLFIKGGIFGVAVGQPFIESAVGNSTQTNYEFFYNFPVSENIRVTPLLQVVTNPSNQDDNGRIISGTLRTVFSF